LLLSFFNFLALTRSERRDRWLLRRFPELNSLRVGTLAFTK
jgi:hypothetical protein